MATNKVTTMMVEPEATDTVQKPYLQMVEPIDRKQTCTIYFEWTAARPDPTSYKQLAPEFHPMSVQIAVEVPNKYVISYNEDSHQAILTAEGMAYASRQINMAISKIQSGEM